MVHICPEARVISNTLVVPDIFSMTIEAPAVAKEAKPGQFLHVRCGRSTDPLLRRPFSVNAVNGGSVGILYQVRGGGTRLLSEFEPGAALDVMGPLGSGFTISEKSSCLIMAGGIGIAPMHFLIDKLKLDGSSVNLLFGCLNKDQVPLINKINALCDQVSVSTNDGSYGVKGYVTDIEADLSSYDVVYSCGPEPMLKVVTRKARENNVQCQVSLERFMACGIGACLSCVCKVSDNGSGDGIFSRVCVDGPVYDSRVVEWQI